MELREDVELLRLPGPNYKIEFVGLCASGRTKQILQEIAVYAYLL